MAVAPGTFLRDWKKTFWPRALGILLLAILGIGLALFSSPNTNAIMSSVKRRHYGSASAMLATMRSLGMMTSMGIVMVVFAVIMSTATITPDLYPAFQESLGLIFQIFFILTLLGVIMSWKRGTVPPE